MSKRPKFEELSAKVELMGILARLIRDTLERPSSKYRTVEINTLAIDKLCDVLYSIDVERIFG